MPVEVLEPIPAATGWEAACILDRSQVCSLLVSNCNQSKNLCESVEKAVWLTPSLPLLPLREEAHSTAAVHHGTNIKECVIWRQCIKLFWSNFSQMPQQCRIMTFFHFCSFPATPEASRISFSSLFMWSNHGWGHQYERHPHLTCRWRPSSASAAVTEEVMMGCHHWTICLASRSSDLWPCCR